MPPQIREIELLPPLAGLSENLAFEKQAPFTSPDSQNMRAYDPDEDRARMGQRPGTAKAFDTRISGDFAVVAMVSITSTYIVPG